MTWSGEREDRYILKEDIIKELVMIKNVKLLPKYKPRGQGALSPTVMYKSGIRVSLKDQVINFFSFTGSVIKSQVSVGQAMPTRVRTDWRHWMGQATSASPPETEIYLT